jgi:transposase
VLARQLGADGYQLLAWGRLPERLPGRWDLPALEALRQIWLQHYDRCTVPGRAALRWRTGDEPPPAAVRMASPYALEARSCSKRDPHGVG